MPEPPLPTVLPKKRYDVPKNALGGPELQGIDMSREDLRDSVMRDSVPPMSMGVPLAQAPQQQKPIIVSTPPMGPMGAGLQGIAPLPERMQLDRPVPEKVIDLERPVKDRFERLSLDRTPQTIPNHHQSLHQQQQPLPIRINGPHPASVHTSPVHASPRHDTPTAHRTRPNSVTSTPLLKPTLQQQPVPVAIAQSALTSPQKPPQPPQQQHLHQQRPPPQRMEVIERIGGREPERMDRMDQRMERMERVERMERLEGPGHHGPSPGPPQHPHANHFAERQGHQRSSSSHSMGSAGPYTPRRQMPPTSNAQPVYSQPAHLQQHMLQQSRPISAPQTPQYSQFAPPSRPRSPARSVAPQPLPSSSAQSPPSSHRPNQPPQHMHHQQQTQPPQQQQAPKPVPTAPAPASKKTSSILSLLNPSTDEDTKPPRPSSGMSFSPAPPQHPVSSHTPTHPQSRPPSSLSQSQSQQSIHAYPRDRRENYYNEPLPALNAASGHYTPAHNTPTHTPSHTPTHTPSRTQSVSYGPPRTATTYTQPPQQPQSMHHRSTSDTYPPPPQGPRESSYGHHSQTREQPPVIRDSPYGSAPQFPRELPRDYSRSHRESYTQPPPRESYPSTSGPPVHNPYPQHDTRGMHEHDRPREREPMREPQMRGEPLRDTRSLRDPPISMYAQHGSPPQSQPSTQQQIPYHPMESRYPPASRAAPPYTPAYPQASRSSFGQPGAPMQPGGYHNTPQQPQQQQPPQQPRHSGSYPQQYGRGYTDEEQQRRR